MSGISKNTEDNYGGISLLYYALQRNADLLFNFEYENESLSISQANFDANFEQLRNLKQESIYDFQKSPERSGTIYNNTIEAAFRKIRDEIVQHLQDTEESKLCLVVKTNNGDWRIIPYAEESADARSGKMVSDKNGVSFSWTSRLRYAPPVLTIT